MPRIFTSANDPLDFCKKCCPDEVEAYQKWNSVGDGPDGRGNCYGYDAEHPDYEGIDYNCEACAALLTALDN